VDLAGLGIHDEDGAGCRLVGLHGIRERGLGLLLDVDVDAEDDVGTIDGLVHLVGPTRDGRAAKARLHDHLAVDAGEDVLVLELETRETLAIRTHGPQDLTTRPVVGIDALGVIEVVDALDVTLAELVLELFHDVGVHLMLDVEEGRVGGHVGEIIVVVTAEDVCKYGGET